MIGGRLTVEDTSGSTLLVGGVETFSTVYGFSTMIVANWQSNKLVDQHSELMKDTLFQQLMDYTP